MAAYLFTFLNGATERVGADRIDYEPDERIFRAICDTEGVVYIAPAGNVRSVQKNPPLGGAPSIDLYLDNSKFRAAIEKAVEENFRQTATGLRAARRV